MSFWLMVFGRGFNSRRLHHFKTQPSAAKYKVHFMSMANMKVIVDE